MQSKLISLALSAAVLVLGSSPSLAAAKTKAAPAQPAASQAQASPTDAKTTLVDINSASKAELKKLPGISDTDATKIIAGRPYGSKAQLVSHDVISAGAYENIKRLIIAKQSAKTVPGSATPQASKK